MMDGDFFVGAALSTTLTKLALRYITLVSDAKRQNMVLAEAMLIMASIIHFGKSGLSTKVIMNYRNQCLGFQAITGYPYF